MIKTLIIDDEHYGRQSLQQALKQYCPEVEILQICESPEAGIKAIAELKPDLVFLDVQMPNMSGFDVLQKLSPIEFEVIFVTSYDQYAIKAIKFSAIDYLLKPLDVDDLIHAVKRTKENLQKNGKRQRYQSVLHNINYTSGKIEKLAVPTLDGIDFFRTNDIIYCEADGSYTTLYLSGHQKQVISKNLKDFENLLTGSGFCRVHNSHLINMGHIQKYFKGDGGYVIMTDDHHVDISRRRKDAFLGMLNRV
ncbi:two component transcriptional regulator, LytTR family [Pricia antarctica]|uniref:Two component transcriptional regulator, LytTR family n=1 Tax=Pricia antarctica TaxID=641691 RepID=A0A1G7BAD4_9FLAO|nr:LytTR family DNA-binding domain-containing protein [Pricia antarctica]SDE24098.1 two component transcriptional regulator, LytTR family [Pricia antarctica]